MQKLAYTASTRVLAIFTLFAVHCGDDSEQSGSGISMYVIANSGLLIRADSNTNTSKPGLAPYGSKVSVIEQSDKTMTIGGKTGHWTKINFNGI